jgi:hypothetical protein
MWITNDNLLDLDVHEKLILNGSYWNFRYVTHLTHNIFIFTVMVNSVKIKLVILSNIF